MLDMDIITIPMKRIRHGWRSESSRTDIRDGKLYSLRLIQ